MKKFTKYLLLGLLGGFCLFATACVGADDTTPKGPQFLEGSLNKIKIGDLIVLEEYVDYVRDGNYTIHITGEDGYVRDVTDKKIWTPEVPGEYAIVYKVTSGASKGESVFPFSVVVPKMTWSYTMNNNFYNMNEEIIFEEFFAEMNVAAKSYYPWTMVMDSVTVDGVKTQFDEDDTSYLVQSFSPHVFECHILTKDGQTRFSTQRVEIRYVDEETMSYLEANNITENGAVTIAEGKVVLKAGEYGGGNTTGAPRAGMMNEQAYLTFNGDYGIGSFVAFDYTGNNMPALAFFVDKENNSMLASSVVSPNFQMDKGFVVLNGITQNDGNPFGKWVNSVCSRLAISGPAKISNIDTDTEGWFRSSIRDVEPISMKWQANNPDVKLRMVAGFVEGTSTSATLAFYLCNRETGEVYYKGNFKTTFDSSNFVMPVDENYYTGKIMAYGQYGKRTELDAIYPVVQANSLQEAIEQLFPLSQFKDTAKTRVLANTAINVYDYIVTVPDYQYNLSIIDEAGTVTQVTDSTFTLSAGLYTLQYKDGKNDVVTMDIQASDLSVNGQDWIAQNNVTYNRLTSISDNGQIVLGAGTTSGDRPTDSSVNDYAYIAFNNDYKVYRDNGDVGVYICMEYTGNNMPNVLFFGDEVTNNIFVSGDATGNKGLVYSNGCTIGDGSLFESWNASVNNRLNIYGPNKIRNMGRDFDTHWRWLVKSAWLGMVQQEACATTRFRLTLGFIELRETASAQYVKATVYLENADTGERYYGGTCKILATELLPGYTYEAGKTTFSDYFAGGKIVVYGQIGKTTTIDKLYAPTQAKGGGGGDVFGTHSQLVSGCETSVEVGTRLNVSDYIVPVSGYTRTLNLIDEAGNVTLITGSTFIIPTEGTYILSYSDGKNLPIAVRITATGGA